MNNTYGIGLANRNVVCVDRNCYLTTCAGKKLASSIGACDNTEIDYGDVSGVPFLLGTATYLSKVLKD